MYPLVELLVCIARKLIDAIEGLLDAIADDTLVQRGLEADLGLPEGALDNAKVKRPELTGIDEYINAVDPDAEKLKVALDSIKAYAKFWTTVFDAAKTEDPSIVVDELVYRLFEYATVDLIKFEHPTGYAVMRMLGVFQADVRHDLRGDARARGAGEHLHAASTGRRCRRPSRGATTTSASTRRRTSCSRTRTRPSRRSRPTRSFGCISSARPCSPGRTSGSSASSSSSGSAAGRSATAT